MTKVILLAELNLHGHKRKVIIAVKITVSVHMTRVIFLLESNLHGHKRRAIIFETTLICTS